MTNSRKAVACFACQIQHSMFKQRWEGKHRHCYPGSSTPEWVVEGENLSCRETYLSLCSGQGFLLPLSCNTADLNVNMGNYELSDLEWMDPRSQMDPSFKLKTTLAWIRNYLHAEKLISVYSMWVSIISSDMLSFSLLVSHWLRAIDSVWWF